VTRHPSVRLNEIMPGGPVLFQHACKMGLEGIVSKRLVALSFVPIIGLAEVQEPAGSGEAGDRRGLGTMNVAS